MRLASPLYLTKYIERMGTGTRDMIDLCVKSGLAEPEFELNGGFVTTIRRPGAPGRRASDSVSDQVTDQVKRLILALGREELSLVIIRDRLGLKHRGSFRKNYLLPALEKGLIEPTIPEKPTSRKQKYRLTDEGREILELHKREDGES